MSTHPTITPAGSSHFEFEASGLSENESVWVKVGNFDVSLQLTRDGIVLDVFDYADEQREDSMASCYAFDNDRPTADH